MGHWLEFVEGTPEQQRLALLEQLFDPTTVRHLDRIGVAPGWKCLEVGAGAGSVAINAGLITRDEIDEAYAHLADPSYVEYLWIRVAAWGQSAR